jgi:rhamnose transport system substrate-binding protein/rhamnose transport system permease protein
MQATPALSERRPWGRRFFPNGEWVLLLVLTAEIAIFSVLGGNFFTAENFFEVIRLSVELGLLALALTPVMVTGGIDLSVGSMMALAAVTFGVAWHDWGWPIAGAVGAALAVGLVGGGVNAVLVTKLRIPAIIVTLGSCSMFRGVAEGVTHGAVNYSGFPGWFLALGQGYFGGVVPVQFPILLAALAAYFLLLHRSAVGRTLYAIGFGEAGARYAGIPVARRLALVYVLSGFVSSVAAIIYVAHLGQAKSDAGTGYELAAITAVVLGGTSVFGGRGTIWGTLLGLFSISVLQNGFRLAALPSELTGVMTGVVLVISIGLGRLRTAPASGAIEETPPMRNSQLAILCAVILAGSLIVAGTNVWLVHSLAGGRGAPAIAARTTGHRPVIAMMPKAKGDPYFASCRVGAEEAARDAGVDLIWDGPTDLDAAKQNEVVEGWITRGVDVIAVAVENSAGISTVLRKARQRGIKVLTWDADAAPDARDFFINQATAEGIGFTLADEAARLRGGKGGFAIITGALSAANQNQWIEFIKQRMAKYPGMTLATVRPSDDDRDKAFAETQAVLKAYPEVKMVVAIATAAVPGAAEAVRQAGRKDVGVIGLSLPNLNKRYVHDGVVQAVVLWNTRDLGYLTVYTGAMMAQGRVKAGTASFQAGRLGTIEIRGDQVVLGKPLIFNKANIDQFDF